MGHLGLKGAMNMRRMTALYAMAAVLAWGGVSAGQTPQTAKKPVTDEIQGVKVTEDYRWLENWDDAAVKAWSDAQNAYARSVLDKLPGTAAIRARVTELRGVQEPEYGAIAVQNGVIFALKTQPPKQQPFIVAMKSPDDPASEVVVVDPNAIDAKGSTSIDFYVPSHDGRLVAVSLSEGGSESGTVHVFETATGKKLGDSIPRVNGGTAGGSVAWNADGSGLYYTRYPKDGERPVEDLDFYQQVYFHKLGTPVASDTYEIGKEFPRIAEVELHSSEGGNLVLASVQLGDGGQYEHFLRGADGAWSKLAAYEDRIVKAKFAGKDRVYGLSLKGAPRGQILSMPAAAGGLKSAAVLVAQGENAIVDFVRTEKDLYVLDMAGGPSQVRVMDAAGKPLGTVPILPVSAVEQVVALGGDEVLLQNESFLQPSGWYRVAGAGATPVKTALSKKAAVDFSGYEVLRETATSKDGTKVPMSIIRKKGTKLDGTNPTLLWGYGGYGVNQQPGFAEARLLWLEQGGVLVISNIRGGGEFGEEWHLQGNLTKKQNVFDDFHACMKRLVELGYCTKDKLALYGGSNGGLLMGAMIVQHPGDFKAVVSSVGIYDMLRVELSPNGAFNVTEFGTVKDPAQFKALYAYSPYHGVRDGTRYPAVLMMTGANDPRVDPMQSRKMTARLQAADPAGTFLLRTSANSGHGVGASLNERVEQDVDRYAFLFSQLGVAYKPVK